MAKEKMFCDCLVGLDRICRWLKISKSTFYRLVREGGLPARREGSTWVASCSQINAWSQNQPADKA